MYGLDRSMLTASECMQWLYKPAEPQGRFFFWGGAGVNAHNGPMATNNGYYGW